MSIVISEDQYKSWKGKKVSEMDLGEWESWALDFFHNKDYIKDPWLQITIRLDITKARENYLSNYKSTQFSSACFIVIDATIFLPGSWEPLFNFAASLIKKDAGGDLILKSNFLSL